MKTRAAASIDVRSFDAMVDSFLALAVAKRRSREIIRMRCGLGNRPPLTLARVGIEYDLSKERIRQVEADILKEMRESPHLRLLSPVVDFVRQQLRRCGGLQDAERLAALLAAHMKWAVPPPGHALSALLRLFPDLSFPRPGVVALKGSPCLACAQAGKVLAKLVGPTGQVAIPRTMEAVADCCRTRCKKHERPPADFAAPLVAYIAEAMAGLHSRDGEIYSETRWKLRNLSATSQVVEIVKTAGRPMHFTEIVKELERQAGVTVSQRNLHSRLGRNDRLLLWGLGSFVYGESVAVDPALLEKIEAWILSRLATGMPYISALGAFRQFRKECEAAHIDSEVALFSCLKRSGNPRLAYPRCPRIHASATIVGRLLPHRAVLKWLKKAGGEPSRDRMKALLCEEMGLKGYQADAVLREILG